MADGLVVVIRCSDRRFQNEWVCVMRRALGEHYVIGGIGGVQSLLTPTGRNYLREQLQRLKSIFGAEGLEKAHFVLLAHGECKAYEKEQYAEPAQQSDLRQVYLNLAEDMRMFFHLDVRVSVKFLEPRGLRGRWPAIHDLYPFP